jgi:hypothetical protein
VLGLQTPGRAATFLEAGMAAAVSLTLFMGTAALLAP